MRGQNPGVMGGRVWPGRGLLAREKDCRLILGREYGIIYRAIRRCVGMADEGDSKSLVLITRVGSTPTTGTKKDKLRLGLVFFHLYPVDFFQEPTRREKRKNKGQSGTSNPGPGRGFLPGLGVVSPGGAGRRRRGLKLAQIPGARGARIGPVKTGPPPFTPPRRMRYTKTQNKTQKPKEGCG